MNHNSYHGWIIIVTRGQLCEEKHTFASPTAASQPGGRHTTTTIGQTKKQNVVASATIIDRPIPIHMDNDSCAFTRDSFVVTTIPTHISHMSACTTAVGPELSPSPTLSENGNRRWAR
jgi:hypothetical protein